MSKIIDFLQRALPIGILMLALVGVPILILAPEGLPRMRALGLELAQVNEENADLRRDIQKLRQEVRDLRENPTAVERIARNYLGLVRKNEIVFEVKKTR